MMEGKSKETVEPAQYQNYINKERIKSEWMIYLCVVGSDVINEPDKCKSNTEGENEDNESGDNKAYDTGILETGIITEFDCVEVSTAVWVIDIT